MSAVSEDSRCFGIDILKTVSMFLVLILHILGFSGILEQSTSAPIYWSAWLLETAAYCAVNCFALSTGYLMAQRPFHYRRIVPLWLTAVFYSGVFSFLRGDLSSISTAISLFFPTITSKYWYFTAYSCLFFFIPFLNLLLLTLNRRQYLNLLLTGFVLLSLSSVVHTDSVDPFRLNNGYSTWWLMYLYLLGAGIKVHSLFSRLSKMQALLGYGSMVVLTWLSKLGLYWLSNSSHSGIAELAYHYGQDRLIRYPSPTIVASAIFLMIFFLHLSPRQQIRKLLFWLSPMIFQVYLIHIDLVNLLKLETRFVAFASYTPVGMILAVLGSAAGLFLLCILLDWLRLSLFRFFRVFQIIDRLANWVTEKISVLLPDWSSYLR